MKEKGNITLTPNSVENDDSGNKIEIYRKGEITKEENCSFDAETNEAIKKRNDLCSGLGLEMQAKFCEKEVGKAEYANRFYPMLSKYELHILRRFLPKIYSKNNGEWKQYQFDIVPTKVLEEISIADSLEIFDNLEIWTPEQAIKDPMVIAEVVENPRATNYLTRGKYFVVSRWGESLKSFEDIVKSVAKRYIDSAQRQKIPSERIKEIMSRIIQENMRYGFFKAHEYAGKVTARHCKSQMHYVSMWDSHRYTYFLICEKCGAYTKTAKKPKRTLRTAMRDNYLLFNKH